MTRRMEGPDRDLLTELAGLLGRGYQRLAERSRNLAVSRGKDPHKELDVLPGESPHVDGFDEEDGPPWKAV